MPWRWQRWIWFVAMSLGLAMYFLSAVPVGRLTLQKFPRGRGAVMMVDVIYKPVSLLNEHSEIADAVFCWEHDLMDHLIGEQPEIWIFQPDFSRSRSDLPANAWDIISENQE